jgi:4-amino-4-deoxy-L-arabinose transferase-like glycosyltransferase
LPQGFAVKKPPLNAPNAGRAAVYLLAGLPAVLYLFFLLATLRSVPFHPDEATYIYMSRDWGRIFTHGPLSICWTGAGDSDPLQTERERDCPLTRYAIAAGGRPAVVSNWDWSASWYQNLARGAVPSDYMLFLARIPQALFLFFTVLLMARIGWGLGGGMGAITAAVLFGLNSQILLHGRRAMSEAALLFGMVLVIAVLMEQKREWSRGIRMIGLPLLAGAALALAALAKYSGLLIAPVALAGMFVYTGESAPMKIFLRGIARCGVLILGFLAVFFVSNPVFWCDPAGTLSAVVAERSRLMADQVQALRSAAPMAVLDSIPIRLLAPFYEWFVAPPAVWEIPNYAANTSAAELAYFAQPLHSLTMGGVGSGLAAVLGLFGLGWAAAKGMRKSIDPGQLIAVFWFLTVFLGILIGVPILWQRYYLPLIPAGAALSAGAVGSILTRIRKK